MNDTDLPENAPWWAKWIDANIKHAWKWASVWWPAFCAAGAEVYAQDHDGINAFVQSHVPAAWWPHLISGAFIATIAMRVIRFTKASQKQLPPTC